MMNKDEIRQNIIQEIEKVKAHIVELTKSAQPVKPDDAIGRISRMDAINNKAVTEAGLRAAKSKLAKLEHASKHLDDEDFGKCSSCGGQIPIKRIMYLPESTYCVGCAR